MVGDVGPRLALDSVLAPARVHGLGADDAASLELAMREGLLLATRTRRATARRVGVPLALECRPPSGASEVLLHHVGRAVDLALARADPTESRARERHRPGSAPRGPGRRQR